MKKIYINKILFVILGSLLALNVLIIFNIQFFYLRAIISFFILTIIPGLLLMLLFKIRNVGFWKYLVYTIGLSISFLTMGGLAINWILPLLHITGKPLSIIPLLISFNIILSIFSLIAYRQNKGFHFKIKFPKLDYLNKVIFTVPVIFSILSVLGAITLNNEGGNCLTMSMLGGTVIYVFLLITIRSKLNENVYPWAIYWMGLSFLLMFSLRSWFLSGWDIYQEYQVFVLTKESYLWSMNNVRDVYNSCLSITLLPTVFSSFIDVNDMYIYKLFFQIIFAFVPVVIFLISKKILNKILGFLSSIFFISQLQYFIYASWIRQEIALLFFSLLFLIMIEKNITMRIKYFLFSIFVVALIVSHYSSTYLTWVILIFTYIIGLLLKVISIKKPVYSIHKKINIFNEIKDKGNYDFNISSKMLLFITLIMFIWYGLITQSTANIYKFSQKVLSNLDKIFSSETHSFQMSLFDQLNIFSIKKQDITLMTNNYYTLINKAYKNNKLLVLYPEKTYIGYELKAQLAKTLPSKIDFSFATKIKHLGGYIEKFVRSFIVVGFIYMLCLLRKKSISKEYILICIASLVVLSLLMIIPFASINYSISRAFQQLLIILSSTTVIGGSLVFNKINAKYGIYFVSLSLLLYFLFTSGFINQLTGGGTISSFLNNSSSLYTDTYTRSVEVASSKWFSNEYDYKSFIYADHNSMFRLRAYSKIYNNISEDVIPSTISINSYVYLGYANVVNGVGILPEEYFQKTDVYYDFPLSFLNTNKNLIYNNGGSYIYN